MVEPQSKAPPIEEAATDMFSLQPPRHISTLQVGRLQTISPPLGGVVLKSNTSD